jgi:hypothetical protein
MQDNFNILYNRNLIYQFLIKIMQGEVTHNQITRFTTKVNLATTRIKQIKSNQGPTNNLTIYITLT